MSTDKAVEDFALFADWNDGGIVRSGIEVGGAAAVSESDFVHRSVRADEAVSRHAADGRKDCSDLVVIRVAVAREDLVGEQIGTAVDDLFQGVAEIKFGGIVRSWFRRFGEVELDASLVDDEEMTGVGAEVFEDRSGWVVGGAGDELHQRPVAEAFVDVKDRGAAIERNFGRGGVWKTQELDLWTFGGESVLGNEEQNECEETSPGRNGQVVVLGRQADGYSLEV